MAETRQSVLDGLRLLDDVLSKLPTGQITNEIVTVDDPGGAERIEKEARELFERKLWVTSLHVQRVSWPEDPEGSALLIDGESRLRASERKD